MREKIPYDSVFKSKNSLSTSNATVQNIWDALRETYKELDMTEYLDELKQTVIDAGKGNEISNWGTW